MTTLQSNASASSTITGSGFPKVKPLIMETYLSVDGNFSGAFINGVGKTIIIREINITAGKPCIGRPSSALVQPGDKFLVTATGCGTGDRGDAYVLNVVIAYEIEGSKATATESGRIRGPWGWEKPTEVEEILSNPYLPPLLIVVVLVLLLRINPIKTAIAVSMPYLYVLAIIYPSSLHVSTLTYLVIMTILGLLPIPAYVFYKKKDPTPVKNEYKIALSSTVLGLILGMFSLILTSRVYISGIGRLSENIQTNIYLSIFLIPFVLTTTLSYLRTRKDRALLLGIVSQTVFMWTFLLTWRYVQMI